MIIINNASYSNVSVTYTADGTQREFSFPFDYLRKAFVKVEVNEEIILVQGTDYSVSDNKTVVFTEAPESGTIVRIFRETSTTRLVSWADASVLRAKDMTIQQVQNLHILEEQQYWVTENAIIRQGKEWNARNFPIKNVGDPVDSKDATNKEYVDNNFMKLDDNGDYWVGRGKTIRDIEEPIRQSDGATKNYVDHVLAGLSITGDRVQTFNSVALMKEAPLEPGIVAMTTGYHNPNDGGASVYTIRTAVSGETYDNGSLILLDNDNVAELIHENTVNVKQFGAYGDNVHDDTDAITKCLYYAYDNEHNVFIPAGVYLHTGLVIPAADKDSTYFIMEVRGESRLSTVLQHTGSGINVEIRKRNNNRYVNGAILKSLSINGNDNTTIGLAINRGTKYTIDDINIYKASDTGFKVISNDIWIASFTNIYVNTCTNGFDFGTGSNTTLWLDRLMVDGTTNIGFKILGQYCTIGSLAADNCSGERVYLFYYFGGSIGSLGCEYPSTKNIIDFVSCGISIGDVYCYKPTIGDDFKWVLRLESSAVNIDVMRVKGITADTDYNNTFVKLVQASVNFGYITSDVTFSKDYGIENDVYSTVRFIDSSVTGISLNRSKRPFLGVDKTTRRLNQQFPNTMLGQAIFTDCTGNIYTDSLGNSSRYSGAVEGTWYMECNPGTHCVAGYVAMSTDTQDASNVIAPAIPLIIYGSSRPESPKIGVMFFDTALNKPIWYKGNNVWVDATGTTV